MKFENTTEYGKESMGALILVMSKTRQRRKYLFRRIFLTVLGLMGVVCGLMLLMVFDQLTGGEKVITVGSALIGILALVESIFLRRLSVWRSTKLLKKGVATRLFHFEEETLETEHPDVEISRYPYSAFAAIYETDGYFVLLLDDIYGMTVAKNGFTSGDPDEFRAFITEKTGKPMQYIK